MDENHKKKKAFRRTKRGYMFKVTILDIPSFKPKQWPSRFYKYQLDEHYIPTMAFVDSGITSFVTELVK